MNQEPSIASLAAPKRFRSGLVQPPCARSFGARIAPDAEAIHSFFTSAESARISVELGAFVTPAIGR